MRNSDKILDAVNAALDDLDCRYTDPRETLPRLGIPDRLVQLTCELWDIRENYGVGRISHATTRDVLARVKAKRAEALSL